MSKAYHVVLTALRKKEAALDMMDDQLLGMDSTMPLGTSSNEFDELASKREELEDNISKMRERIELINAWEQLKNGDWSEEVKGLLKDLDINIAQIADQGAGADPMAIDPMAVQPAALPPAAPVAPPPPPPPVDVPPAPAPEPVAEEVPADVPAEAEPELDASPMASVASSKKTNYESPSKKADTTSTSAKGVPMAQNQTKTSLKAAVAETKTAREARESKARTRVTAAWTIAKTMLPTAPAQIQEKFASIMLQNSTKVLVAALRQTAVNAHAAKLAEDIKRKHKVELNDLLEEGSVLSSAQREVETEIKGDAKSASGKVADDRKDAGPQPESYTDGRNSSEPKELDASKAGERPANTVDKSEETDKTLKAAAVAAKAAHGKDCKGCDKCATKKKADMPPPPAPEAPVDAPPAPDAGAPVEPSPADGAPEPAMGEPGAEAEGETVLTEEKKMDMKENIDEAEQAIQNLLRVIDGEETAAEEGVMEMAEMPGAQDELGPEGEPGEGEPGGEEIDIEQIFDQGGMEDKESSLANQDNVEAAGDDFTSFFGPSASADLESDLEPQTASITDMFNMEGSDADPLAFMFGSHEAADVAGFDVIPSFSGEAAKHFETETSKGDDRDSGTDHEDTIWAEALQSIKEEGSDQHRVKQDETNVLEKSPEGKKAASRRAPAKKAAYTGPIRPAAPKTASSFNAGEALLGSFSGDE